MTEVIDSPATTGEGESQIAYSSIPVWARPGPATAMTARASIMPAPGGASYVLVGVGDAGAEQVQGWADALTPDIPATCITDDTAEPAGQALRSALAHSVVGVRVLLAGTPGACLALRAVAVNAGLEDDELTVATTGSGEIDVFCSHCRTVNHVAAQVDDEIDCAGCTRRLLVYYHVSRRSGHHLGFMVDAENPNPEEAAR